MEPKITIGEIISALETDIFDENSSDSFIAFCKKREDGLKKELDIIGLQISNHFEKPGLKYPLEFWQIQKSKDCMRRLALYAEYLVSELSKDNIENYCRTHSAFPFNISSFNSDIIFLMMNSFHGSVINDFFWIDDLPLFDMLNIIQGKFENIDFKKKTILRVYQIEEYLKKDKQIANILRNIISIDEISINLKNNTFRSLNLLLIADIEKSVRNLGNELIEYYNLEIDPNSKEYNSIDSFLRKIPWKSDLNISFSKYSILTCNYDPIHIRLKERDSLNISLKDRLDFLRRRFSLQRNQLFHGQEEDYNYHLNSFVNASALMEVLKTYSEYKIIYTDIFDNK